MCLGSVFYFILFLCVFVCVVLGGFDAEYRILTRFCPHLLTSL